MTETIILSIALFIGIFVQTTIGFAASLASLPILLIVFDLPDAIAYLSSFMLLFSAIMLPKNWHDISKKLFFSLSISATIGLILGTWLLNYSNPDFLKKFLGIFVIIYVAYQYLKKDKLKFSKRSHPIFGFLGGFFSGLFNSGGAIFLIYVHSRLSSIVSVRATIIGLLAVNNFLRVPLMVQNGMLTKDIFTQALWTMPAFFIAIILGHVFYKKINKDILRHIMMTFLMVTGILLMIG